MGVSLVGDRSAKPDDNDNYGDDDGDGEIDEHVHLPFKIPPGRNMSCYDMSGNVLGPITPKDGKFCTGIYTWPHFLC